MKHTLKVTITLVLFFFVAQFVGLLVVNQYIDHQKTIETKEITYKPLPYNLERPEVQNQSTSFIYVIVLMFIGTGILLLIIKTNKPIIWKIMFFISVFSTLTISFSAFINQFLAGIIALTITILKIYKPNVIIQNFSEIFIYGGLAAVLVNIFNIFGVVMLLIIVSIYDYISVYKTKHMIDLAKFQSQSKIFAGLFIPYQRGKISLKGKLQKSETNKRQLKAAPKQSVAVLGGGDIGFTLIFAGVVMKDLILQNTVIFGFLKTLIVPVCVSIALLVLLLKGQQNKFYPAMPILSFGCFIGYLIVLLL